LILYQPIFGAYTELFAGFSNDIKHEDTGRYIVPWGQFGTYRKDLIMAIQPRGNGGTGHAERFWAWTEKELENF
jgi:retinol dehydrogenase 12